jgi:hypothetical protein
MGATWTSALFLSVIVMLVAVAQFSMNAGRAAQPPKHPSSQFQISKEKSCSISTLSPALRRRVGGVLVAMATGCSKPADQGGASTASAPLTNASTVSLGSRFQAGRLDRISQHRH